MSYPVGVVLAAFCATGTHDTVGYDCSAVVGCTNGSVSNSGAARYLSREIGSELCGTNCKLHPAYVMPQAAAHRGHRYADSRARVPKTSDYFRLWLCIYCHVLRTGPVLQKRNTSCGAWECTV